MALLIDSGFLYATVDIDDNNHQRVVDVLPMLKNEKLLLPTIVLVEVAYLLQARLGHTEMRQFIAVLEKSPLQFETITKVDTRRIYELLETYSDIELDFVDATCSSDGS